MDSEVIELILMCVWGIAVFLLFVAAVSGFITLLASLPSIVAGMALFFKIFTSLFLIITYVIVAFFIVAFSVAAGEVAFDL